MSRVRAPARLIIGRRTIGGLGDTIGLVVVDRVDLVGLVRLDVVDRSDLGDLSRLGLTDYSGLAGRSTVADLAIVGDLSGTGFGEDVREGLRHGGRLDHVDIRGVGLISMVGGNDQIIVLSRLKRLKDSPASSPDATSRPPSSLGAA